MSRARTLTLAFLVLCIAIIGAVRTLPRRLAGAAPAAVKQVRAEIAKGLDSTADAAVDDWIGEHPGDYEQRVESRTDEIKAEHTFTAADGREHPYLGDYDSYMWIHLARNYVRNGTVCDEVVDGVCRDRLGHAPVGREMLYAKSLHTAAIAVLHKLITVFSPGFPISSTAFFVPVIVGMLGAIPAFCLGRRFGGLAGAVTAALVSQLNPAMLIRSIGSDNDIWNVVLPLYAVWAAVEALAAAEQRRRLLWAAAAGVAVALHAATWSGWPLSHGILAAGFGATLVFAALRAAVQTRAWRVWTDSSVRRVAAVVVAYFVAAGVAVTVVNPNSGGFMQANAAIIIDVVGNIGPPSPAPFNPEGDLWPHEFASIAELLTLRRSDIRLFTTNVPFLFGAFLGMTLLALGESPWRSQQWALLAVSAAVVGYGTFYASVNRFSTGLLMFAPTALAVAAAVLHRDRERDNLERGALLLVLWLVIAYAFGTRANRFVMFFAPPVGVAAGVVAGRLYQIAGEWLEPRIGSWPALAASTGAVVLLLATPLQRGYVTARDSVPQMNDAWWQTFTDIRDNAPAGAIVNLWWHHGHWAKYISARPVIADGASLRSHILFWFTHALLAPDEAQTAGLLRMLDCGSDATPYPEGSLGAYGKLRAQGLSVLVAEDLVDRMAGETRDQAARLLAARGLRPDAVTDVLASSHCQPPPMYLVLDDALATTAGWGAGRWDFRRAYVVERARHLPRDQALRELTDEVGYTPSEARRLYRAAEGLRTQRARQQFIAPELGFLTKTWVQCTGEAHQAIKVCPLARKVVGGTQVLDAFEYSTTAPAAGRLRIRKTESDGSPSYSYRTPGTIFIALADDFRRTAQTAATDPGIAILIDVPGNRILIAEAEMLGSTFTKLVFLDGRYLTRFEKISVRDSTTGERVVSYRVRP